MWDKVPGGRHQVVTDGLCFRKFPFDDSKGAGELIQRDADVLRFLGTRVEDVYDEKGKLGFETGKLGFPIEHIELDKALLTLDNIARKDCPDELNLGWVGDWAETATRKIYESIGDKKARGLLLDLIPKFFPVDRSDCDVVCHTDVHAKNWLVDGNGSYSLIDWEYAVCGTSDVDIACLAFALVADERFSDAFELRKVVHNKNVWDWVIRVKAVSTAGWLWSSNGKWSEVNDKIGIIDDLCFASADKALL